MPIQPWSVVIPDEKAQSERLQSIATIQKRLQALLDEGRMLRQSIEVVSGESNLPTTVDSRDPKIGGIKGPLAGRGKKPPDS
jgi:hypothetical protein